MIQRSITVTSEACAGCCGVPKLGWLARYEIAPKALVCSARCARKVARDEKKAARKPRPDVEAYKSALIALTNTAYTQAALIKSRLERLTTAYPEVWTNDAVAIWEAVETLLRDVETAREEIR